VFPAGTRRHLFRSQRPALPRIDHAHIPSHSASRDRLSDPSHPHDPQGRSGDGSPEEQKGAPLLKTAFPDHAVAFDHPPRHAEDEGPGEIGGGIGQYSRGVGYEDAALGCSPHVDVVETDRHVRYHPQPGPGGVHDRPIHCIRQQAQQGVLVGHAAPQLVARDGRGFAVEIDLAGFLEAPVDGGRHASSQQDPRLQRRFYCAAYSWRQASEQK